MVGSHPNIENDRSNFGWRYVEVEYKLTNVYKKKQKIVMYAMKKTYDQEKIWRKIRKKRSLLVRISKRDLIFLGYIMRKYVS